MTLSEANEKIRQIVAGYFGDSHTFYADVKMAKKTTPYVTIKLRGYGRQFFANKLVDQTYYEKSYREITGHVDINLYTQGKDVSGGVGQKIYINTAMADMEDFLKYLDSDDMQDELVRSDMSMIMTDEVKDLSEIVRENTYEYRALAQFDVHLTDVAYGTMGQDGLNNIPNSSGGGSDGYITGYVNIDNVEIEEENNE